MASKVIILNGPSCAGKSSIAQEICNQSNNQFVHLQIDEFKKFLFTMITKDQVERTAGRAICDNMVLNAAHNFLDNKLNVVIDTIFDGNNATELAKNHINFFKNCQVLFVGIDCPLEERLRRFRRHNDNVLRKEKAIIDGSGYFALCKELYNLSFDSSEMGAAEIAGEILQIKNSPKTTQ